MTAPTRAPDFYWSRRPVYRCRVCGPRYERVDDLADVLEHEAEAHPAPMPAPPPALRESRILGTDGRPLLVEEA